ncbi:MAG: M1 family aminopeptidase [Bacteroidota bacterium]
MNRLFLLFFIVTLVTSCSSSRFTANEPMEVYSIETRLLDTLVVRARPIDTTGSKAVSTGSTNYRKLKPSRERKFDLIHTKLDLSFSFEKEEVYGIAELKLTPYFYEQGILQLDAKGFAIHSIYLEDDSLSFNYDNSRLSINLPKVYSKNDTIDIIIDYTARPSKTGGSAAITSDQGLFFINPSGEEETPQQIWTQGETEWNSRWFPTIDSPNERCTQEITLTVEEKFQTLSNGLLINSTPNGDGTRTDYWKLDIPHAPYLFAIIIGEFAVVEEEWNGKPIQYFVEKEFEEDAPYIYPHTPEMLTFFSEKLNFEFPWPKYSQVIVRDFVSGAMENSTAVVFGDFMQRKKNQLYDQTTNEKIVAHELFHHWFGNYVTCESWANLTMNEGFANYSEYLWLEYKYGKADADGHLIGEWQYYLNTDDYDLHPLIHFQYRDKEDLFDNHSYNKGGAVLHMLRNLYGDEAFWMVLNKYLHKHAFSSTEAHDLRLIYEEVIGLDLNWFWDQWYFDQGHPTLNLDYNYEVEPGKASLQVSQVQNAEFNRAVFKIPNQVAIYYEDGTVEVNAITIDQAKQTFEFPIKEKPALMLFDPNRYLLCKINKDNTPIEAATFQFKNSKSVIHRTNALNNILEKDTSQIQALLPDILKDKYWELRKTGIRLIKKHRINSNMLEQLVSLATKDPNGMVRDEAYETLYSLNTPVAKSEAAQSIQSDSVLSVISSALYYLHLIDKDAALKYAEELAKRNDDYLRVIIAELYVVSEDPKFLDFFEGQLEKKDMTGYYAVNFYDLYQLLLIHGDINQINGGIDKLVSISKDMNQPTLRRAASTLALNNLREQMQVKEDFLQETVSKGKNGLIKQMSKQIKEIVENETDQSVLNIYSTLK